MFAGPIRHLRSPRTPGADPTRWQSAILKARQTAPVHMNTLGLVGDAQKERKYHGGPAKAVLIYGAGHYAMWDPIMQPHVAAHTPALRAMSADIDASRWDYGAFGENLCVDGLEDRTICIGDLWQVGAARLRITEPRGPCGTLARRWIRPTLIAEVREAAAAGWYNAVEVPGEVANGDTVRLLERMQEQWTVADVFVMLETPALASAAEMRALRDHPCAHDGLREHLDRRLSRG